MFIYIPHNDIFCKVFISISQLSFCSVTQTCERFTAEAKYKSQCEMTNTKTSSTNVPDIDLKESSEDNTAQKRPSKSEGDEVDNQAKRQRLEPSPNVVKNGKLANNIKISLLQLIFLTSNYNSFTQIKPLFTSALIVEVALILTCR